MLSAEQIQSNWITFLSLIKEDIPGERGEKLEKFFDKYAERFALMPASGKTSYHNAFPGGYIDHVIRVHRLSFEIAGLWEKSGANVPSMEQISFVALLHDLGKFGDFDNEEYLPQDQDWAKKRGEEYKHNPDISFMKTSERSLFLIQALGIELSQEEYLGIKLHDGLYEEANKAYYIAYSDEYRLRSNLAYIVHQADLLATRIEHDNFNKPKLKVTSLSHPITSGNKLIQRPTTNTNTDRTLKEYPSHKHSISIPGVDMKQVIPSSPHIVKENSSKPVISKPKFQGGKYAALLNKLK